MFLKKNMSHKKVWFHNIITIVLLLNFFLGNAQELKSGDLIFQVEGKGDFSHAISSATGLQDSINFVHVGIIEVKGDTINVIEASPEKGVCITPYNFFIERSPKINGKPGAVIKRIDFDFPVDSAIFNAKRYLGDGYDWWYLPDNGKIYCSELVYESFYDNYGKRIFQGNPMNFRSPDGSMPEFWVKLYEKLGVDIPEGVIGTNPNDMSKSDFLREICRFF